MKKLIILCIIITVIFLFSIERKLHHKDIPNYIGTLKVLNGPVNTKEFTTEPGSAGKPGNIVKVYQKNDILYIKNIFDWKIIDEKLEGNHIWYQLTDNSWIYNSDSVKFYSVYGINYLCSDKDFQTVQNPNKILLLIKSYKNNKLTTEEINYLNVICKEYNINQLVLLAKIEQESSLIFNMNTNNYEYRKSRCLGYGVKTPSLTTFSNQIKNTCRTLNDSFNNWDNQRIKFIQDLGYARPLNAATYALYIHCPVYGSYHNYVKDSKNKYSTEWSGNEIFVILLDKIRKKYSTLYYNYKD